MRRPARFVLALAAAALGALLLAAPASAHAVVVGSDPADGSRLSRSPAAVTIRFDEPVGLRLGFLRVVDSAGRRVDSGAPSHPGGTGTAITVALRSGLGDGSYLASFRVTSADSHPIAGSIRWVVGNGALGITGAAGSTPVDRAVSTGLAVSHWLSFAGVALVGGSWLIFALWPDGRHRRPVRRLVWSGWGLAAAGAVTEYLLQGPYAAGTGLGTVGRTDLLDATLHVNAGQLLSLRVLLLGVLGMLLTALFADSADRAGRAGRRARRRPSWAPEAAAVVGAGIVVTFAAAGHSQSLNPRWFSVLVNALHLGAMIVWLGGLAVLLVAALGRRDEDGPQLAAGLPVFSRVALACVAALGVTGTIQAWREVGTVEAITTTRYGQLVLVKVVLFAGLVGLGYLARRAVLLGGSGSPLPARLRRTLVIEVVVGGLVLAATGVLISQPPGKVALAAERSKPRHTSVVVTANSQAQVEVDPGVHGNVQIAVQFTGGQRPTQVTATASLPDRQLGPIPVPLRAAGAGSYTASNVLLPAAGKWEISLTVQTSEFDSTVAVAKLRVS